MAAALRSLGAHVEDVGDGDWLVTPGRLVGGGSVDCGLAGNVMRFVPPLAALADGPVRFDGDPEARRRPMAPVARRAARPGRPGGRRGARGRCRSPCTAADGCAAAR